MSAVNTRYADSAATREVVGEFLELAAEATAPEVATATGMLRHALDNGGAWDVGVGLQILAPRDIPPMDAQLFWAAVSLAAALWHVETGTDASLALDGARDHLAAARQARPGQVTP